MKGYSPAVRMYLIVGRYATRLARLGNGIFETMEDMPAMPESGAQIIVDVDNDVAVHHVRMQAVAAGERRGVFGANAETYKQRRRKLT